MSVVSKQLNAGSCKKSRTIAVVFLCLRSRQNSNVLPQWGCQTEVVGAGYIRRFWTNISLYLRNSARQGHSYYGMLIETRMCCIEWYYFHVFVVIVVCIT